MNINLIVAVDSKNGIGKNNSLPWNLPGDLTYFKDITTNSIQEGKQNIVLESDEYSCPFCGQEGYLWNDVGMFRTIFENLVFDTYLDWLKHKFLILNE